MPISQQKEQSIANFRILSVKKRLHGRSVKRKPTKKDSTANSNLKTPFRCIYKKRISERNNMRTEPTIYIDRKSVR